MAAAADKRFQQEKSRGMKNPEGYKQRLERGEKLGIIQSQERPDPVKKMKSFIFLKTNGTKPVEDKSQERPYLAKEMKNLLDLVCRIFQTYLLIITELIMSNYFEF